jgi:hypothetical protein
MMGALINMLPTPEIVLILNLFKKSEQSEEKRVTLPSLFTKQSKENRSNS